YRSVRDPNPGRRGDSEFRPTLEGWRDSLTPSNPAVALGPIEAVSAVLPSRRRHPSLISKQHASRVLGPRGDQEDPSATLPDAEVLGINGPVRPTPAVVVEPSGNVPDRCPPVQGQHVGHVLKYEPRRRHIVDQAEHFADQARLVAANAGHPTHLAEVGTGKTRRHHVGLGQGAKLSNVADNRRIETAPQDRSCGLPVLAQQVGLYAGSAQPEFESPDAGEEPY